ncbi:MAG: hypothetical protein GY863_09835 [bacterium]|nr:hypothetical protein [bacterium]
MIIDIDKKYGPWTLRVWGLILNLIANSAALYGIVSIMKNGSGWLLFITGLIVTLGCILILAIPDRSEDDTEENGKTED